MQGPRRAEALQSGQLLGSSVAGVAKWKMRVPVPQELVAYKQVVVTESEIQREHNPTPVSNWVIPKLGYRGGVIAGAHPFGLKDINALLDAGVTSFLCLMQKRELDRHSTHYMEKARRASERDLHYVHLPVEDCKVPSEADAWTQVEALVREMEMGRTVYVHCRGGHGRTGVVVSLLLAVVYHCTAFEALERCGKLHATRESRSHLPSPQTSEQRNLIHRLVASLQYARDSQ